MYSDGVKRKAITIRVDEKLKREFKSACAAKGITVTSQIEKAMQAYVVEHFKQLKKQLKD